MGSVRAVSPAQAAPTGPARAVGRRSEEPLPRRTHPSHLRPQRASAAPHDRCRLLQHDQLRARLGSQDEPFQGAQVDLVNVPKFCVKRASNLYVSAAKSAQARNTESGLCFFFVPHGVPSERKPGADRAPGRRFSFGANQQKHSSDLRPPLSGRSIPLLFFKARARQQNLEPRARKGWEDPDGTICITNTVYT